MLPGHEVTYEQRTATCCDQHRVIVAICACGEESSNGPGSDAGAWVLAHRLDLIENALTKHLRTEHARRDGAVQ